MYGDEIVAFVTCGYEKLHLYLWEAMKQMIMPTATQMRAHDGDFMSIVAGVLTLSPSITANRKITL